MTNEELILERLDRIEAQLAPMVQTAKGMTELKQDVTPLLNLAVKQMIGELEDIESSFQLEDLLRLLKRLMRSTRNITFALNQLENIIDFIETVEPLMKSAVPQFINYLDDMEQRGVFRIIKATLDIRAKLATAYTAEDIDKIGDGVVALIGLTKKITDPQTTALLEKLSEVPAQLDLTDTKDVGPFGLLGALSGKEAKQGLGVMLELTKALGKLKQNSHNTPDEKTG
ncbi:MAG: DUF1641 domain-containing protein [Desulfobacterales bacterium]